MNEREIARKILKALQDAGLVPRGFEDFTEVQPLKVLGGKKFVADGASGGRFTAWVSDKDEDFEFVVFSFCLPKPAISPTAKALKELKA